MSRETTALDLHDFGLDVEEFLGDALAGLRGNPKTLPCKYFYDERGSRLFDRICELPEYYPTRTERGIMERCGGEMAAALGPDCLLIEYGSGSSLKTRILLDHLETPAGYVPLDISREHLLRSAEDLSAAYPGLEVLPVCADYTGDYQVPEPKRPARRRAVYFPGSTIGNFTREQARDFLVHAAEVCGDGGGLLVGVDLKKDPVVLERAYDDAQGVTAAFNLNLLERMNRELRADFRLDGFRHRAIWNEVASRIEMHLESVEEQVVQIDEEAFVFAAGETICTEHSHKYDLADFAALGEGAGFQVSRVWTDPLRLFSVQYLVAR